MSKAGTSFKLVSNSLIDTILPLDSSPITIEPTHDFKTQNKFPVTARNQ